MRKREVAIKINNNSNNRAIKDGQNDKLEKKETLIRTSNWSRLYGFETHKHYTENNLEQRPN